MNCNSEVYSEDYIDLLVSTAYEPDDESSVCVQENGEIYRTEYLYRPKGYENKEDYRYYSIPKLYGLLDDGSLTASGIYDVRNQPALELDGEGVLIGIVDTGIAFAGSIFKKPDTTSRIIAIWDQTGMADNNRKSPPGFIYGIEYSKEDIDNALKADNPYDMVPSTDDNGHGTYAASVAAGNTVGAAPEADIAVVKLKPAKQNIRDYYQIQENVPAYQENDIMAGVIYLYKLAQTRKQPLVLCIALGTSSGAHNGNLPLARTINTIGNRPGVVVVSGTGNETARARHFSGMINEKDSFENVEIRVGAGERGFITELWAKVPEIFSVSIQSPKGETIPRIFVQPYKTVDYSFLLEKAKVEVSYRLSVIETGEFLASIRLCDVTPGIWTIRVYNDLFITGKYDMWLPVEGFTTKDTVFLRPDPDITLTSPSDAESLVSVSTYNHRIGSIYLNSGRGYTPYGGIRPDIAAPGADIEGYVPVKGSIELKKVTKSGSSAATAHTAGAAALLSQWAMRAGRKYITSAEARAFFIRGAKRKDFLLYPNREWGFGSLNVYGIFTFR